MNMELTRHSGIRDPQHAAKLRVMIGATGIFGLFPLSLSPLVVAAAQRQGHSLVEAGILATCLLAGVSSSAVTLGAMSDRLSLRVTFRAGVALLACIQLLLLALGDLPLGALCLLWTLGGVGSGCGIVVGDVMLARTRNPMMTAGQALALSSLLMLFVFPAGSALSEAIGMPAMSFLSLGSAAAALALVGRSDLDALARRETARLRERPGILSRSAIGLAVAIAFFWIRDGMIWSFSASNAEWVGLASGDVGLLLGAAGVCGVLGCCASAWVTRSGAVRRGAAVLAAVAAAVVAASWTLASEPVTFVLLQLAYNALQLFTYPFLLGLAAQLDGSGRIAAIAGGMTLFGAAVGPIGSSLVTEMWGAAGLFTAVAVVSAVSVLALVLATRRQDARAGA